MTGLRWNQRSGDDAAIITSDGHELARYSWGQQRNHPFFHPVRPLGHRGVVTNHAPWDHRWHHGLWWSWKFINRILFWEDHEDYGGEHDGLGRSVADRPEVEVDSGGVMRVVQRLSWDVGASSETLLDEERTLSIRGGVDAIDQAWSIDWDLSWAATNDPHFTTTPASQHHFGGYGGLNVRMARSMVAEEQILASGGRTGADAVHREPASWMAYTGCVDGAGTDEPYAPARGGAALLEHPDNGRYPAPAYVCSATGNFGFLASAPLMHEDLHLTTGERLRLRYRVLILAGHTTHDELEKAHRDYGAS